MTPRPPRPLPDRRPRAVLLGAGDRGAAWLPALLGGPADLVGVMDPDAERARALLAAHPHPLTVAATLDEALGLRPDLVVDASSPHQRLAVARRALDQGARLLLDPPLALDEESGGRLLGLAREAPLSVADLSPVAGLEALLRSGVLGPPRTLLLALHPGAAPPWAGHPVLRGPAQGALSAARRLLGAESAEARAAEGRGGAAFHALFTLADGTALALHLDEGAAPCASWLLVAEGGTARLDADGIVARDAAGTPLRLPAAPPPDPHAEALRRALDGPARPPREAAEALALALAALRSARAGGRPEPVRPLPLAFDAALVHRPAPAAPRDEARP